MPRNAPIVWSDAHEFMLVKSLWRDDGAQDILLPGTRLGGQVRDDERSVRSVCAMLAEALWPDAKLPTWDAVRQKIFELGHAYLADRMRSPDARAKWYDLWREMAMQRDHHPVRRAVREPYRAPPAPQPRALPARVQPDRRAAAHLRNPHVKLEANVKKEESIDEDEEDEDEEEDEEEEEEEEDEKPEADAEERAPRGRMAEWQRGIAIARERRELIKEEPAPVVELEDNKQRVGGVKREREEDDAALLAEERQRQARYSRHVAQQEREDERRRDEERMLAQIRDQMERQQRALGRMHERMHDRNADGRAAAAAAGIALPRAHDYNAFAEERRRQNNAFVDAAAANRRAAMEAAFAEAERRRQERRQEALEEDRQRKVEQQERRREREALRKQAELRRLRHQLEQWKLENSQSKVQMDFEEQRMQQEQEQERQWRLARDQERRVQREARYAQRDELLKRGSDLIDAMQRAMAE